MSDPVALALIAAAVTLLGNILALWKATGAAKAALAVGMATKSAIDAVGDKTEIVHKAVNSQLDAFKKEAAQQYALALEQAVSLVRLEAERISLQKLAVLEAKIADLEARLKWRRDKTVAQELASDPLLDR
ncbi:MAG: hypothetical protein ACHQ50_15060 [Fimbriimonadales bacterium]